MSEGAEAVPPSEEASDATVSTEVEEADVQAEGSGDAPVDGEEVAAAPSLSVFTDPVSLPRTCSIQ